METTTKNEVAVWTLDPAHSELTFKVKHLMISNVKGIFTDFKVEMHGNGLSDLQQLDVEVATSSISTNNTDRDNHLRSADFFDADSFPKLTYRANDIQKETENEFTVNGSLSIKGVERPVRLHLTFGGAMKDPYGNEKIGFSVETKINRKDFGLNWNAVLETGGLMVSEEVKIEGDIQLVKQ